MCGTTRVPADVNPFEDTLLVDGVEVEPTITWAMTVPFNMLATNPVWSLPAGLADNGVPVGIQLVGRPSDDAFLAGVALAWDEIRPDLGSPSP